MKKNIFNQLSERFISKAVLAVSGSMILMSCGAHVGGYSETDGVYYDPETDTLPEGVVVQNNGNQVGGYYDYYENSVIDNSRLHQYEQENKYSQWNGNDSDWGLYAGEETNIYDNSWGAWGPWGYPYWGSGLGMGWGWGSGFGMGMGMNWGWGYGSWFGYNPYMSWGWGGYNPYMFGYSPFWNYYSPLYYGYGAYGYNPYYYGGNYPRYQRSGTVGRGFNSYMNNGSPFGNRVGTNSGFRNGIVNSQVQQARGFSNPSQNVNQNSAITPRRSYRNPNSTIQQQQTRPRAIPRYNNSVQQQQQRPSNSGFRNNSGVRGNSGGFNSGSSGGGFRGGSSGSRSGGFR